MGSEEEQQQVEEEEEERKAIRPDIPLGRVKRIMKLDKDINKINSEALFLVTCSTQLFLNFLAQQSAQIAAQKKRKTIKLDHLHLAVKRHKPSSDFLLDSLPVPAPLPDRERPLPNKGRDARLASGSQKIDTFFKKKAVEVDDD